MAPSPDATPRNRQEYEAALAAQRDWFIRRLWIAAVGFLVAVSFGGFTLQLANDAQNDAEAAAREARATALVVAARGESSRRLNVANDLRGCVRSNEARAGVRLNSQTLAELVDAVTPGLSDHLVGVFKRNRVRLQENIDRNAAVDCTRVVDGIELLTPQEIGRIIRTRGRANINP